MKIFLSWSGETSHQVAKCLRDWLPSVIQNIEPYVSSEDIDKGARWSTDIAKELENSSFGILCVTKENLNAAWLNFEAGALSKTMDKTFVTPFLFDIKRSEVNGPVLQFQSTVFEKEDIHKLLKTINKALGKERLTDERLDKSFEVWFPTLEKELQKIKPKEIVKVSTRTVTKEDLMEEVLELSRINQKLLRSLEDRIEKTNERFSSQIDDLSKRVASIKNQSHRKGRMLPPFLFEEFMMQPNGPKDFTGAYVLLSLWKEDFPWVYEVGMELCRMLESKASPDKKKDSLERFYRVADFSLDHPVMKDMTGIKKDLLYYYRDVLHLMMEYFHKYDFLS